MEKYVKELLASTSPVGTAIVIAWMYTQAGGGVEALQSALVAIVVVWIIYAGARVWRQNGNGKKGV